MFKKSLAERKILQFRLLWVILFLCIFSFNHLSALAQETQSNVKHQPIVEQLIFILEAHPDVKEVLQKSVDNTKRFEEPTLASYFEFLDKMITKIPNAENWLPMRLDFYYVITCSPDKKLKSDPYFQPWVHEFVNSLGRYLDTTASVKELESFIKDPAYNVADYIEDPSGWLTYNQFFARHIKAGKRPIAERNDERTIVFPADSIFKGQWEIDQNSEVTAKGLKWSVLKLLDGSPYQERFKGGTFTHSYLSPRDYHRYHTPVSGVIKEIRKITGEVVLDVYKKDDGTLAVIDGDVGYQFIQERGLVIIDSPLGLVAMLPIGMGIVSSVNFTADKGATLVKGEELGYFAFGGSDIILLFEAKAKVTFSAEVGVHYLQGSAMAKAVKK
jgi:phosphatidylserine decarboxylase precursor